jgi:cell shape-determining protein MreC
MNYLLRSSNYEERRKNIRKRISLVVLVMILILFLLSTGPARKTLFFVAEPVWKLENAILNSNFFQYFKFKQTLINEKKALEQKLFMAGNLMDINAVLLKENETLKDMLGRKEIKNKTVLASILVKPPQTPYDTIIVDAGADYGVKVGDKVVANANVYLGEVSEVQAHSSKITLYSSPGRKMSVVLGLNQVSVEAVGTGGGNFNITLPRELGVKEGDIIVIPAITSNVFGIVEKVNFKDTDSFQKVLFKSPVNISDLSFVEIVI